MATPAQIEANRANAQQSTGPRTEDGKARSSRNSLRDGIRSQSVLLPSDNPAAYEALLAELEEHFTPEDLTEQRFVGEMADAEWRLRRARLRPEEGYRREYENFRTQFPELGDSELDLRTFENLHRPGAAYPRLITHEAKFERQYDRAYAAWVKYNDDNARARTRQLQNEVNAIFATPLPEKELPTRTIEPNSSPAPTPKRTNDPNSAPAAASAPRPAGTNEPNSAPVQFPRNAPCPCGSGQNYKRCRGRNAPPVLFPGAHAA